MREKIKNYVRETMKNYGVNDGKTCKRAGIRLLRRV